MALKLLEYLTLRGMLVLVFINCVFSQNESSRRGYDRKGGFDTSKILDMPGEILAKGQNTRPVGPLQALTYRLERVRLEEPALIDGQHIKDAGNLFVTSAGVLHCPCTVFVNDNPLTAVNFGPNQAVVQFFGKPQFEEGSTLAIADQTGAESTLSERLTVPPDQRAGTPRFRIGLQRIPSDLRFGGRPAVQIDIVDKESFPIRNNILVVQIGRKEFAGGAFGNTASAEIPEEEFWNLPDNAPIYLKWGFGSPGQLAGRLNKGAVH